MDTWQFGAFKAVVDPEHGGRLAELWFGDLQVLVARKDDAFGWGCYPMAPWAGRVRDARFQHQGQVHDLPRNRPPHALHGTVLDRPWRRLGAEPIYQVELGPAWPFPGFARMGLEGIADGFTLWLEVHAQGGSFPASLGWHPWFLRELGRGGSAVLDFHATTMYRRAADDMVDGVRVPPTDGPWDDCFVGVKRPVTLTWPGALRLALDSDTEHWVVYNLLEHALCVEPWSGPPDALNLEPRMVTSDQPLRIAMHVSGQFLT